MGSAARRLAYNPAGLKPKLMIDINSMIARDRHSVSPDPGEASVELKERAKRYPNDPGFQRQVGTAATAVENVVRSMIDHMVETGEVHPGLLSFYASRGVPIDTLEKLASGGLPMDDASRAARAKEMGLDPDMVWTRHDIPMLDHARLQHRGGLTYAGFTPWLANQAAVSKGQQYSLIASPAIIGLQRMQGLDNLFTSNTDDVLESEIRRVATESKRRYQGLEPSSNRLFDAVKALSTHPGYSSPWDNVSSHIEAIQRAENLSGAFSSLNAQAHEGALKGLVDEAEKAQTPHGPKYGWAGNHSTAAPGWKLIESASERDNPLSSAEQYASQAIQDRAKAAGARGSLVSDEGGASVAFMYPEELRHADLSLLDPAKKGMPGYFYGILPAAAAVGAQQQEKKSPLQGLTY